MKVIVAKQQRAWWGHMAEKNWEAYIAALERCNVDIRDGSCADCGVCPLAAKEA